MTTASLFVSGFTAFLMLLYFGVTIYILYIMYREKGIGYAILGFFIAPFAYIWGWINAAHLKIVDVMALWTVIFLLMIAFPTVASMMMTAQAFTQSFTTVTDGNTSVTTSEGGSVSITTVGEDGSISISSTGAYREGTFKGNIGVGQQVNGTLVDFLDEHDWKFDGVANQTVRIVGRAAAGSDFSPRITLVDTGGNILTFDRSFDNEDAVIDYTLPANGTYTIQIEAWGGEGDYTLLLN